MTRAFIGRARERPSAYRMATAAVFLAGCLTVIGLYWQSDALNNQYDDAYITYRYAVNLAQGHGLVFNQGERMDSASSLSYVLLLAGAHGLGLHDLETVASVIGSTCWTSIFAIASRPRPCWFAACT